MTILPPVSPLIAYLELRLYCDYKTESIGLFQNFFKNLLFPKLFRSYSALC